MGGASSVAGPHDVLPRQLLRSVVAEMLDIAKRALGPTLRPWLSQATFTLHGSSTWLDLSSLTSELLGTLETSAAVQEMEPESS